METGEVTATPGRWSKGGLIDRWASDKWAGWTPEQIEILKEADTPAWQNTGGRIQWKQFFRVHPDAFEKLGGDMMKLYQWSSAIKGMLAKRVSWSARKKSTVTPEQRVETNRANARARWNKANVVVDNGAAEIVTQPDTGHGVRFCPSCGENLSIWSAAARIARRNK